MSTKHILVVVHGDMDHSEWLNSRSLFALGLSFASLVVLPWEVFLQDQKTATKGKNIVFFVCSGEALVQETIDTDALAHIECVFADIRMAAALDPTTKATYQYHESPLQIGWPIGQDVRVSGTFGQIDTNSPWRAFTSLKLRNTKTQYPLGYTHISKPWILFQGVALHTIPYGDCRLLPLAEIVFGCFEKMRIYTPNASIWGQGKTCAVSVRDDDVHAYLTKEETQNHQTALTHLLEAGLRVSLALVPLGSQFVRPWEYVGKKSPFRNAVLTLLSPLREVVGTLMHRYAWVKRLVNGIFLNQDTADKNADSADVTSDQGVFHGVPFVLARDNKTHAVTRMTINGQTIGLGEDFTLTLHGKTFTFAWTSVNRHVDTSKAFFGVVASIENQFDSAYLNHLKTLVQSGKIGVSIHAVTHHQHRLTDRGANTFGEFYVPGTETHLPSQTIAQAIERGCAEVERVFGQVDKTFTDAYGHPTPETVEALRMLQIPYYPHVEWPMATMHHT